MVTVRMMGARGPCVASRLRANRTFLYGEACMIRISITAAAFDAIAATLPGSVLFEREPDDKGERRPVKGRCFS